MKIDTPQIEKTIELEHATDTTIARSSAGQVTIEGAPVALDGYTTTATAAGTTTLTVASTKQQYFTGTSTQTVTLPVTSTLVLGQTFVVRNLSTGIVTVNSSGANVVLAIPSLTTAIFTCILTSGTTAASWSVSSYLNTPTSGGGATCLTIIPKQNLVPTTETNTGLSVNTTGFVGQVVVPFGITVNKLSFNTSFVTTTGTVKVVLYSEDGQTKIIDVTSGSLPASGSPAIATISVSSVSVSAGVYYIFICPVSTTNVTIEVYLSNTESSVSTALNGGVTSEPKISGTLTITAGTPPATFTPSSITASDQKTMIFRLDN